MLAEWRRVSRGERGFGGRRVGNNEAERQFLGVLEMSIFPTKVVLGIDGSQEASRAAEAAVELCKKTDSELHVVHIGEDFYLTAAPDLEMVAPTWLAQEVPQSEANFEQIAQKVLDAEVEKVEAAGGTVAQAHLRMGRADAEIVNLAEEIEAGLVVLGSRGLGGVKSALLGSVSYSVIRHAHCPVLVVR
jgi:nucleotide-binding universal stress UspA family protein